MATQTRPAGAEELLARARAVSREVAARHAADVDAKGRFPSETIAACREAGLLSAAVPTALGGSGASMHTLAELCHALGEGCGSSAMVVAMHHIEVALLVRHGRGTAFFDSYLRAIAERQLLLASVTSEVGVGGDTRTSICALERANGRYRLVKDATTVSYGAHADGLLLTCRRAPDAPPGDQVLVLARREDYRMESKGGWDTMGMRGTCSPPFLITCEGPEEQVLPVPYAEMSAQTMVPYSHILWSSLWTGIAADAVARAASSVRAAARKTPGTTPPAATRLAEAAAQLQQLRSLVFAAAADFDALGDSRDPLGSMGWALRLNHVKVGASQLAQDVVHRALQVTGIAGYKNDSPLSVARHYRDVLSAALMVANDRILAKSAAMLLVHKND